MKKSMQELGFQQLYGPELQNIPPPKSTLAEKIKKAIRGLFPSLKTGDYAPLERRVMGLQFRCRVCNKLRPDKRISVRTRDASADEGFPLGTVQENFNYCNDRRVCKEVAMKWKGTPPNATR